MGAQQNYGGQPGYAAQPAAAQGGLSDNVAAGLAYLVIPAVIWLVMEPYNRNRFIRFHSFQSLFLFGASFVLNIGLSIVGMILGSMSLSLALLFGTISMLISLAMFILWVYLLIMAFQGKKTSLPVIGPMAEAQAAK